MGGCHHRTELGGVVLLWILDAEDKIRLSGGMLCMFLGYSL